MSGRLEGKVAVVTGGASGIGAAIVRRFVNEGARVVLTDIQSDPGEKIARETGGLFVEHDVGSAAGWQSVIEAVEARHRRLDILVNNAGIIRRADSLEFTEEDWDAVMGTNLKSVFFLSQAVARRWVADGRGGKIINVVSMLSFQGGLRVPSYTASKSGLAGVTKTLCNEWAARGINVNGLAPGYFATNNTAALQADADRSRQILERIPAGRWGRPEDLGGAAVFLASRASDYMHGAILAVDGGWLAR